MRARLETWARRWWAGELGATGRVMSALGAPLSWGWGRAMAHAGRRGVARAVRPEGVAVVSIGNLAVGGTGKTPVASWVASKLLEVGARPALVVGASGVDEAALLERRHGRSGVPVLIQRDRAAAAERARLLGADVVVLDDGFQHRRLARDVDVVLLSAEDAFPGPLLPCGPYREPPTALARADVVLVTRRHVDPQLAESVAARAAAHAAKAALGVLALRPCGWADLQGGPAPAPEGGVLLACGVARSEGVRAAARAAGVAAVEMVAFADHHEYTAADARRLKDLANGRRIVVTEKDAVKLERVVGTDGTFRVLVEEVAWDRGEEDFLALLRTSLPATRP